MAIMYNGKPVTIYEGDYKPVNEFRNRIKVGGYKEQVFSGKQIAAEDTYNDALDLTLQGHHSQKSENAVWFNQINPNVSRDKYVQNNGTRSTCSNEGGINRDWYANHKYLFVAYVKTLAPNDSLWYWGGNRSTKIGVYDGLYYNILSPTADRTRSSSFVVVSNFDSDASISGECGYKNLMVFDLTAMFGEGKEPTSAQFRKMFPCDYYPYNDGEWMYAPKGQWVKFNQIADYINWNAYQCTKGNNGNTIHLTGGNQFNVGLYYLDNVLTLGHKYFISAKVKFGVATSVSMNIGFGTINVSNVDGYICCVTTFNTSAATNYRASVRFEKPIGVAFDEYIYFANYIDLTSMFGEGNEPSTVEEFKALYPNEYYEYTEGRYEDTGGFVVNGQKVPQNVDTSFVTPFSEMPEPIEHVENPKVDVTSEGVMWNQLAKVNSFRDTTGLTTTKIDDYTVRIVGVNEAIASSSSTTPVTFTMTNVGKEGHKYLLKPIFRGTYSSVVFRYLGVFATTNSTPIIITANSDGNISVYLYITASNKTFDCTVSLMCHDLTSMFGEGNEPTSVEEFKAMFPNDYYKYDAGTFRTIKALHQVEPKQFVLPFTSPINKANNIEDGIEFVDVDGVRKIKVTRRVGAVDIGTLPDSLFLGNTPPLDSNGRMCRFAIKFNGYIKLNPNFTNNIYIKGWGYAKSASIGAEYNYTCFSFADGRVFFNVHESVVGEYNNLAFKRAMNGVVLYYELETPTEEILDTFELYGANGVYDTVEPNVLVDGVRKCRVTRRWERVVIDGSIPMGTDSINIQLTKKYPYAYFNTTYYAPVVNSRFYSNQFRWQQRLPSTSNGVEQVIWTTSVMVFNIDREALGITDTETYATYTAKFQAYFKKKYDEGNPVIIVYQRKEPIVELYDPIDIRTMPINTIVLNDQECEMSANIKVVDNA